MIVSPRGRDRAPYYAELREKTDGVWCDLAASLGFTLVVSQDAFVTYDGDGNIGIAPYSELDDDDLFAQIVFHELCHWRCEGVSSREHPDWGLDNMSDKDVDAEHAALLLQARWASAHGLEDVLVPTTDFRVWYEALPSTPWQMPSSAARRAHDAWSSLDPAFPLVDTALAVTAQHARGLLLSR